MAQGKEIELLDELLEEFGQGLDPEEMVFFCSPLTMHIEKLPREYKGVKIIASEDVEFEKVYIHVIE